MWDLNFKEVEIKEISLKNDLELIKEDIVLIKNKLNL